MSERKRVTLKDIANKTGFTINTVSRALKDRDDISDSTKEIIRQAAKELHYVGDVAASALRSGTTKTIAVIVGDIANPFFSAMVRGIELVTKRYDYSVVIFNSSENAQAERSAILSAYSKRVDGIIICPVQDNTENLELLQGISIPFVLLGRYFPDIPADAVVWDDLKAGEIATQHLIDQGHVNILYIGGPVHISGGMERLQGYRNAHARNGLTVREELVHITSITTGASREAVLGILREKIPFTALVAFSDLMACEIVRTLNIYPGEYRNHIPIVSFDNIQEKTLLPLYFPSVDCKGDSARECVELLMKKIRGVKTPEPTLIRLDVELVHPEL